MRGGAGPREGRQGQDQGQSLDRRQVLDFNPLIASFKSIKWRSLQRYASPQSFDDLNRFLEKLPRNTGNSPLLAAGTAWLVAACIGLFTYIQIKDLTGMRAKLAETKALQPVVPKIKDKPGDAQDIKNFAATLAQTYPGLSIKPSGAAIQITAKTTASFAQFREAVGHVQNGGSGWRVSVDRLCVGRECKLDQLGAVLKITKVSIDKPQ
jgi:hypothetical protein